jgi:hypothetical protein
MKPDRILNRCAVEWMAGLLVMTGILFSTHGVQAQDDAFETLEVGEWAHQAVGSFSGSQAGYTNWSEGGVNTLSFTASLRGKSLGVSQRWKQRHEARLAFGAVKTNGRDYRKAVDVIHGNSAFLHEGDGFWQTFKPTVAMDARTQFVKGLNYRENPFNDGREPPVKVSGFMSPAYIAQTIGLTYEQGNWFSQRLGLSSKQTIVIDRRLRSLYGLDTGDRSLVEGGVESETSFDRVVLPRTRFKSSLTLFQAFKALEWPDMYWETLLEIQANQWLTTNVSAVFVYNADVSSELQIKEVISVGISFTLI